MAASLPEGLHRAILSHAPLRAAEPIDDHMLRLLVNVIAFQVGWFSCVLGAAHGHAWLGPAVVFGLVLLHVILSKPRGLEVFLVASAIAAGLILDSLLVVAGAFSPKRLMLPSPLTTLWMLALWANFATTLNVSLRRLQEHAYVAAALGAVFGPLAYYSGARLGAADIHDPLAVSLLAIAVAWAIATPVLLRLARQGQPRPH